MIYAIGDIHGQYDMLNEALMLVDSDGGSDAHIVFVGDYIDRGPDSKKVINTLIEGKKAGRNWTILRGNHDRMFCRFINDGVEHDDMILSGKGWLHPVIGGQVTLESYNVDINSDTLLNDARAAVPKDHIAFLMSRPLWFEKDDKIFVHAGIRPSIPITEQIEDDLIWIREDFLNYTGDHGKLIVHGHTAMPHPLRYSNRVNLDGGAGFGRPLQPVVFEGNNCWILTADGRQEMPLQPIPKEK